MAAYVCGGCSGMLLNELEYIRQGEVWERKRRKEKDGFLECWNERVEGREASGCVW